MFQFNPNHILTLRLSGVLIRSTDPNMLSSKPANKTAFNNHKLNVEGGLVAEPMVKDSHSLVTVDYTSLYPSNMVFNNLCASTYAQHSQVKQVLNDQLAFHSSKYSCEENQSREIQLAVFDAALNDVFKFYSPHDICCQSWMKEDAETNSISLLKVSRRSIK